MIDRHQAISGFNDVDWIPHPSILPHAFTENFRTAPSSGCGL
jgi:hypothetical protein